MWNFIGETITCEWAHHGWSLWTMPADRSCVDMLVSSVALSL